MQDVETRFSHLVQARLLELGENAYSIEKKNDFPEDTIRGLLRNNDKRAKPSLNRVNAICDALGLDFYIGPRRETSPVQQVTLDAVDYASIPVHDAWLSAGPGIANARPNIIDHLAFRRDWLARIGVAASQACLARVIGDSMFPTLSPGDMVLLDTSKPMPPIRPRTSTDKRRPAIWALVDNGEARIKRVERPNDSTMLLLSDNPDHPPELLSGPQLANVQIIGKVVWWGHTSKE